MAEDYKPTYTSTACHATTIPLSYFDVTENDLKQLDESLSYNFDNATSQLVFLNEQTIRERVTAYANGPYTYLSWHHDHTTTIIGDKVIVSMLSTALVGGEFSIEEESKEEE